jgi:CRP-like cAMP-binding protein
MAERSFAVVGMICGGFVFSTLIGNITAMAHKTDISKQERRKKMDLVGAFVRDHTLPKHLKFDVLEFFNRQEVRGYEEKTLLAELPFSIRQNVLQFTYSHLMEHASLFHAFGDDGMRERFMVEFLCVIHPISFYSGASVFSRGDPGFKMFLVADGIMQILSHDRSKVSKELTTGAIFGCGAVMGDPIRRFNVKAYINSKAVSLEMGDAVKLMAEFPEMRQLLQAEIEDEARRGEEVEMGVGEAGMEIEMERQQKIAFAAVGYSECRSVDEISEGGSVNEFIAGLMPTPAPSSPTGSTAGEDCGRREVQEDALDKDRRLESSLSRLESHVEKVNEKLYANVDGIKKQLAILKKQLAIERSSRGRTIHQVEFCDI